MKYTKTKFEFKVRLTPKTLIVDTYDTLLLALSKLNSYNKYQRDAAETILSIILPQIKNQLSFIPEESVKYFKKLIRGDSYANKKSNKTKHKLK